MRIGNELKVGARTGSLGKDSPGSVTIGVVLFGSVWQSGMGSFRIGRLWFGAAVMERCAK